MSSGNVKDWTGRLKDYPAFILGNAPCSLDIKKVDLSILNGFFTIGINRIFLHNDFDPTILIWQDLALWIERKKKIKQLQAIKYCRKGASPGEQYFNFRLQGKESRLTNTPEILYGRGSSGALSFQLANVLGCNPIVLCGMDCKNSSDGKTDFWGQNKMHRRGKTLSDCVKGLRFIKSSPHKKTIINCSKNVVFTDYKDLKDVIDEYKEFSKDRNFWKKKILEKCS